MKKKVSNNSPLTTLTFWVNFCKNNAKNVSNEDNDKAKRTIEPQAYHSQLYEYNNLYIKFYFLEEKVTDLALAFKVRVSFVCESNPTLSGSLFITEDSFKDIYHFNAPKYHWLEDPDLSFLQKKIMLKEKLGNL